jgi:hypothetical protein
MTPLKSIAPTESPVETGLTMTPLKSIAPTESPVETGLTPLKSIAPTESPVETGLTPLKSIVPTESPVETSLTPLKSIAPTESPVETGLTPLESIGETGPIPSESFVETGLTPSESVVEIKGALLESSVEPSENIFETEPAPASPVEIAMTPGSIGEIESITSESPVETGLAPSKNFVVTEQHSEIIAESAPPESPVETGIKPSENSGTEMPPSETGLKPSETLFEMDTPPSETVETGIKLSETSKTETETPPSESPVETGLKPSETIFEMETQPSETVETGIKPSENSETETLPSESPVETRLAPSDNIVETSKSSAEPEHATSETCIETEPTPAVSQDERSRPTFPERPIEIEHTHSESLVNPEPALPSEIHVRTEPSPPECNVETEPAASEGPVEMEPATQVRPVISEATASEMVKSLVEIPANPCNVTVENAILTFTRPESSHSSDIEKGSSCVRIETSDETVLVPLSPVGTGKGTIPEEQSTVLTYFGLKRKQMEGDLQTSAAVNENPVVGTEALQIQSPGIRLGSMREVDETPPKGFERMSSLLRQARIRNKIKGRPWITGTSKDRRRYLQEKAKMAAEKVRKRGRPAKRLRCPTNSRLGRPKGSKNKVKQDPGNFGDGMRKSDRQPKTSQKMLEYYETNCGQLYKKDGASSVSAIDNLDSEDAGGKRKLSAKFQNMIDSLLKEADEHSEFFSDSDVGEASASETEMGRMTGRKSKRSLKLSAKMREMMESGESEEDVPGFTVPVHRRSGSEFEDEGPPPKRARLAKEMSGKKSLEVGSKYSHLIKPSSVNVKRININPEGGTLKKGMGPKKKKSKLVDCVSRHLDKTKRKVRSDKGQSRGPEKRARKEMVDTVHTRGAAKKVRGPDKTPRKERSDKGQSRGFDMKKRGPDTTPRKRRCDTGIRRGPLEHDVPRKRRCDKGILRGPLHSTKPRKDRWDKGIQRGPLNSSTPRKVRWDSRVSKKDREKLRPQGKAKQMSKQSLSATGAPEQNFCMVSTQDFSQLLKTAGTVVYVLPPDSHLGQLAAASNSVMCLVPQNDDVVIPPGAIPVQAISNSAASASETTPSASTEKHSVQKTVELNENSEPGDVNVKPRKVRSDKGKPKGPRKANKPDTESDVGTMHSELDLSIKPRKVRSDKGIPKKPVNIPCPAGTSCHLDTPTLTDSVQTPSGSIGIKKPRKSRSDKGVPRKLGKSPSQAGTPSDSEFHNLPDTDQSGSISIKNPRKRRSDKGVTRKLGTSLNESDFLEVPTEPDSGTEYSGIYLDPRECLSYNSTKPRKVRSDKGITKGPRKTNKAHYERDLGTVVQKSSGRPKIIQTSKDDVQESYVGVNAKKKLGRPQRIQGTLERQEFSADCFGGQDSAMDRQEQVSVGQVAKRPRKPKLNPDYVSLEDDEFEEGKDSEKPTRSGKKPKPALVENVVNKKRGRPPKNTLVTENQSAVKWMKVTISPNGSVVPNSPNIGGDHIETLEPSTSSIKKHTARKSFPEHKVSRGASVTCSLYSDIFPGGGIPVPVKEKNPILSQVTGGQIPTPLSETDTAVMSLTENDPTIQEELVYVDLVMDPSSLNETQPYSFLAASAEGLQGTLISGIEAQQQAVGVEIIDASHLQPLLDHGVLSASGHD